MVLRGLAMQTSKDHSWNMFVVPRAIMDWFFFTTLRLYSISTSPEAGEITIINYCKCGGTVLERFTWQGSVVSLPKLVACTSSRIFFSTRSDTPFNGDVSIATGQEWNGTAFHSYGKRPQINLSIKEVPSNWSTARFSTIPNHACAWRPLVLRRDIRPCIETTCLMPIFSRGDFTCLTLSCQLSGKPELLRRLRPGQLSNRLATVWCNPPVTFIQIITL